MLVTCAAYQAGKKIAELPVAQIREYLSRSDTFVWVAIRDPEPSELDTIQREFNLHELAVEDARQGHQRPKIEEYGDSLFVVFHTIETGNQETLDMGEVAVFVGKNYVLTIRHKTTKGFAAVRERCEQEPELLKYGPGFVLYAIMDSVVDRYIPVMDFMERELERIEERIFSRTASPRANIESLYSLKQKLLVLQHATQPLLEISGKLFGGRVPTLVYGIQDYFRDIYDHTIRITRSIESSREMTTTAIQVNLSFIALAESEVSKKLAAYGALFAVPTAIAGIYGMNFKTMPELSWDFGYPFVLSIIVILDIGLWLRFRKTGWL